MSAFFAFVLLFSSPSWAAVDSVCVSADDSLELKISVEGNALSSLLTVQGKEIPFLGCRPIEISPKYVQGWRCTHADGSDRYELYPAIDVSSQKVLKAGLIHWNGESASPALRIENCR
jgi:hypothetical protein